MFEKNFLKFMNQMFPDIKTYAFFIPEDAPTKAFCFENAGNGISTNRNNEEDIISRTIKLTFSSTDVSEIFEDSELTKYVNECHQLGDLSILKARILSFNDNYYNEQKLFERTYSINFKYKKV